MIPVLQGSGLHLDFGDTRVLRGVDIAVGPGEIVAVMGPSGSGKSSLLHVIAGLLKPSAGVVELDGQRIDHLGEKQKSAIRLRQLGFVFQSGDLVPELTLVENVELPLRLTGVAPRAARTAALDMMEKLGILTEADRKTNAVSGGQAQRAAVARALVHKPAVVLADEPTGALDSMAGELVLESFVDVAVQSGTAVVLVTHDLKVASYAQRDIQLQDGQIYQPVGSHAALSNTLNSAGVGS